MKEVIYTIPLTVSFDKADGCPFCYLRKQSEDEEISKALGASLMQPEIRIQSNETGFCERHLKKLNCGENNLGLALMLSTHIETLMDTFKNIRENINAKKPIFKKSGNNCSSLLSRHTDDCIICSKIDYHMERYIDIYLTVWKDYKDKNKYICLSHLSALFKLAEKKLGEKDKALFINYHLDMAEEKLNRRHSDLCDFIKMFDYNFNDLKNSVNKSAIEDAAVFLRTNDTDFKSR